jgi:hypothetical protein
MPTDKRQLSETDQEQYNLPPFVSEDGDKPKIREVQSKVSRILVLISQGYSSTILPEKYLVAAVVAGGNEFQEFMYV